MKVIDTVVLEARDGSKVRVSVRSLAHAFSTSNKDGALGAVLAQLANSSFTARAGEQITQYLLDTNEHPTLIQGTMGILWSALLTFGRFVKDKELPNDPRLAATLELTRKLVDLVDEGELPTGLPCV